MLILNYLPLVLGMVVLWLAFSILRSVFSSSQQASSQIVSSYTQIIFLRMKIWFVTMMIIGICVLAFIAKVNIPNKVTQMSMSGIDWSQMISTSSRYAHGDNYEHEGKNYRLVEKATYRLNNLAGLVPEVNLDGTDFYMVPKK